MEFEFVRNKQASKQASKILTGNFACTKFNFASFNFPKTYVYLPWAAIKCFSDTLSLASSLEYDEG